MAAEWAAIHPSRHGVVVPECAWLCHSLLLQLLYQRIEQGRESGEKGFVLDGFPRTVKQAQDLVQSQDIQLAINLQLREEVLIEKCMGRRICKKCGKGWNVADIHQPASKGQPEIIMPPLDPPVDCLHFMEQRDDDKEEVRRRSWLQSLPSCSWLPAVMPILMCPVGDPEQAGSLSQGGSPCRRLLQTDWSADGL